MKTIDQHNAEVDASEAAKCIVAFPAGVICGWCDCTEEMVYKSYEDVGHKERIVICPRGHKQTIKKGCLA